MAVGVGRRAVPTIWQIPDDLWVIVQHVLPREELQRSRGRPWIPPRRILDAVLYVLCLDKGYDYADADEAVWRRRFVGHIRRRGEERRRCRRGERARRWVVERTHSWFNRHRKLLIRWEKKPQNYLALMQFAAMLMVWRLVG